MVARLSSFWLPDEVALYIGLAGTSVRRRVQQYYTTPLGEKPPHAGGWWLKTLTVLDELWVHWALTSDTDTCESAMLTAFADGVSSASRAALHDSERVAPFANLRTSSGLIKRHGITGATGVATPSASAPESAADVPLAAGDRTIDPRTRRKRPTGPAAGGGTPTQRITAKDFEAGRIRLPARSKHLLPSERADVRCCCEGDGCGRAGTQGWGHLSAQVCSRSDAASSTAP